MYSKSHATTAGPSDRAGFIDPPEIGLTISYEKKKPFSIVFDSILKNKVFNTKFLVINVHKHKMQINVTSHANANTSHKQQKHIGTR